MPERGRFVPDWLARRAADQPDAIALIAGSGPEAARWTYGELDARAARLALFLRARDIAPGDRVAALLANGPAYVETVHALIRLRAILVPLNLRLAPDELAWQLGNSGARLLLCDNSTAAQAETLSDLPRVCLPVRPPLNTAVAADYHALPEPRQPGAIAQVGTTRSDGAAPDTLLDLEAVHCIIYTSGTTGRPKGTLLTYGNLWWSAIGSALNLGLRADDRWLACLPFFHIGGLSILLRAAIYGISVVLPDAGPPRPAHFDAMAVNQALTGEAVTIISVVSAMLPRLFEAQGEQPYPPTLRCMLLGGGPAPRPLLEECARRGVPVTQTYGLTETCSQVATLAPADALRKLGAAGQPLLPNELRIVPLDDVPGESMLPNSGVPSTSPVRGAHEPAERGRDMTGHASQAAGGAGPGPAATPYAEGEILVRGPSVTMGYLPASGDIDTPQPAVDSDGWLHTGDVGYLDGEGFLYVLDRRTDLVISGGENIYPAEVEAVLRAHPAVGDAGVYGIADERWGQRVAAAVAPRPGMTIDAPDVLAFCRTRLAAYKVPATLRIVETLPRNAGGKLLRRALRDA